jgi:hypothetical protein
MTLFYSLSCSWGGNSRNALTISNRTYHKAIIQNFSSIGLHSFGWGGGLANLMRWVRNTLYHCSSFYVSDDDPEDVPGPGGRPSKPLHELPLNSTNTRNRTNAFFKMAIEEAARNKTSGEFQDQEDDE